MGGEVKVGIKSVLGFCRMILAGEVGLLVARESLLLARKMV